MITLVSSAIAKRGYTFIHEGETPRECERCKLKATCIDNLEKGRRYTVIQTRSITHPCALGGKVTVVDVSEPEIILFIDTKIAFKGISVAYHVACEGCKMAEKCMPAGLVEGDRVQITDTLEDAPCTKKKMKKVAVRRI